MKTLPKDFKISSGNLTMRLVIEEDADFIVSLRSDPNLTNYMIMLDADVEKQKEWISQYKIRERKGEDCFFMYFLDNERLGTTRISHIDFLYKKAKASSWIKRPSKREISVKMFFMHKYIIFEVLDLNSFYSDIHKDNQKPLWYYREFEYPIPNNPNQYGFLDIVVTKEDYYNSKNHIIEKYNIEPIREFL